LRCHCFSLCSFVEKDDVFDVPLLGDGCFWFAGFFLSRIPVLLERIGSSEQRLLLLGIPPASSSTPCTRAAPCCGSTTGRQSCCPASHRYGICLSFSVALI